MRLSSSRASSPLRRAQQRTFACIRRVDVLNTCRHRFAYERSSHVPWVLGLLLDSQSAAMLRSLKATCYLASSLLPALAATRLSHLVVTAAEPRSSSMYHATVESVRDVAGTDIRLLRMKAHEALTPDTSASRSLPHTSDAFSYAAGQWVDFHIPGVDTVGGYSIISAPVRMPPSRFVDLECPPLPFFHLAVKKVHQQTRCN